MTWFHGLEYIDKLNAETYLGFNDWRMPNVIEMLSLVDHGRANPALPLNHPFTNVADWYFTATTRTDLSIYGWSLNLQSGAIDSTGFKFETNPVVKCRFLAVRVGSAGTVQLPQTGQTRSYAPRDDGALRSGIQAPTPRFMAVGDGTVRDRLTGLMWPQSGPMGSPGVTWANAFAFLADMNSSVRTNFGHVDWRLPNRLEALSLIDRSQVSPALSPDHPFASGIDYSIWTSSTSSSDTTKAWYVSPAFGTSLAALKSGTAFTWPVRADSTPLSGHAIRGCALQGGEPLAGARIELSGPLSGTVETDSNGQFAFTFLPDGQYRVRVSKLYRSFTPPEQNVSLAGSGLTLPDFTGELAEEYGWVDLSANLPNSAGVSVLSAMCFVGEHGWIASGSKGEIYHTADGGRSFEIQSTRYRVFAVAMRNAEEGYAGGDNGLYQTSDGGKTWKRFYETLSRVLTLAFSPQRSACFAGGASASFWRIDGTSVTRIPCWFDTLDVTSLSFPFDDHEGWLLIQELSFSALAHYRDGVFLTDQASPTVSMGNVCFVDNQHGWAPGLGKTDTSGLDDVGHLVFTTDGNNWNQRDIPAGNQNRPNAICFLDRQTGWMVGKCPSGGLILTSSDAGTNWTQQAVGLTRQALLHVFPVDARTVYASGNNGTFLKYTRLSDQSAQPRLSIAMDGANVVLGWPASVTNFTLTTTYHLGTNSVWTAVTNPPSVIGSNRVVTNAATGTSRFYRLQTSQ